MIMSRGPWGKQDIAVGVYYPAYNIHKQDIIFIILILLYYSLIITGQKNCRLIRSRRVWGKQDIIIF